MRKIVLSLGLIMLTVTSVWAQDLPKDFATVKNAPKVTMLEFSAPWCLSCQKLKPTVEKLEKELNTKLKIVYLNVDKPESQKYIALYKIESAPTFILFNAQGKQIKRIEQDLTPAEFQGLIQKAVN